MNNEEIRAALLEAFKAGVNLIVDSNSPLVGELFSGWLERSFPELLKPTTYRHPNIMCRADETVEPGDKSKGCCCYD